MLVLASFILLLGSAAPSHAHLLKNPQQRKGLKTEKTPLSIIPPKSKVEVINCPGGVHVCLDNQTCCLTQDGKSYGCCPIFGAVCCSDGLHCCPSGDTCDLDHTVCLESGIRHPILKLAGPPKLESVMCPDGGSCPNKNTCCKLLGGQWGCCPIQNAVCCSDMEHCCPAGYSCNSNGACFRSTFSF